MLAVVAVVLWLVGGPLRSGPAAPERAPQRGARADLEAAKDAKLREIRDAELDYRTGKLSREDWERLDASLRAEANELLGRLDSGEGK